MSIGLILYKCLTTALLSPLASFLPRPARAFSNKIHKMDVWRIESGRRPALGCVRRSRGRDERLSEALSGVTHVSSVSRVVTSLACEPYARRTRVLAPDSRSLFQSTRTTPSGANCRSDRCSSSRAFGLLCNTKTNTAPLPASTCAHRLLYLAVHIHPASRD